MSLNVTQPCLYERDVFAVSCLSLEGPGVRAYFADAVNFCEKLTALLGLQCPWQHCQLSTRHRRCLPQVLLVAGHQGSM